jgi:hypothetical protein
MAARKPKKWVRPAGTPSSVVYEGEARGRITPRLIQLMRDHNASERLINTALEGMAAQDARDAALKATKGKPRTDA